jgi:TRAP-type C4-dicarboxylate transport system substrate-binding protein
MSLLPSDDEDSPLDPDDQAAFQEFLDNVEQELAKYSQADHREALDRILRDANEMIEEQDGERAE